MRVASVVLFSFAAILLFCGQAFYVFFFLPDYHGSFAEAIGEGVFDWNGWWSFTKSVPGLLFRSGAFLAFLGGMTVAFISCKRSSSIGSDVDES